MQYYFFWHLAKIVESIPEDPEEKVTNAPLFWLFSMLKTISRDKYFLRLLLKGFGTYGWSLINN